MTELERRLTETLESGAEAAPDANGLAAGARDRARRRSRSRAVGGVAAVVLAVAAVPVAVTIVEGGGSAGPTVLDTPTAAPATGAAGTGRRTEAYRDLEIQVPASWDYGNLSTWCLNGRGEPGRPVVERPGGVVRAIGCGPPGAGYGVRFLDTSTISLAYASGHLEQASDGQEYPSGSWFGYQLDASGNVGVLVVAPRREVAEQVLASARTIDVADSNGCAVSRDGAGPTVAAGTVAVCRYDADDRLEQSELLTGSDAASASEAVQTAPPDHALGGTVCPATPVEPYGVVLLREPGRDVTIVVGSSCDLDNGVSIDGERRLLTADVVYWVLSPGWSGVTYGDVPLPNRLRR